MKASRRRFLRAAAGLSTLAVAGRAAAANPGAVPETLTLGSAINKAGRQRMLSQRIAKAYCEIGLKVWMPQAQQVLTDSVRLFDSQLAELQTFAPTADIRQTYQTLSQQWAEYKSLATAVPSAAQAARLAALSDVVLKTADAGTGQLAAVAGTRAGRLINTAGRQRMLSQRMAKFYMLVAWRVDPSGSAKGLAEARAEFQSALDALSAAAENTREITEELQLAKVQWLFFDNAVAQQGTSGFDPQLALNVATTSERILQVMDRVTGLYERLAAKSSGGGQA